MELPGITMETISHIFKSEANFLCKSHVGSKGTNLCHMMGTASLIKYGTLETNFSPTPGHHTLAEVHSFLCPSKLQVKIKPALLKFCTEKQQSCFVRERPSASAKEIQHHYLSLFSRVCSRAGDRKTSSAAFHPWE